MREAELVQSAVDRVVRHRQPELFVQSHDQVASPPTHHPMDRGDRAFLDNPSVAAREKAVRVIDKLRGLRPVKAAELAEAAVEERRCFPEEHWRRIRTTDEMDKDFFATSKMRGNLLQVRSFVRRAGDVLPSRLPISHRRAQRRSRLAASCAVTARLGLDRPEHGGMLDRIGIGKT